MRTIDKGYFYKTFVPTLDQKGYDIGAELVTLKSKEGSNVTEYIVVGDCLLLDKKSTIEDLILATPYCAENRLFILRCSSIRTFMKDVNGIISIYINMSDRYKYASNVVERLDNVSEEIDAFLEDKELDRTKRFQLAENLKSVYTDKFAYTDEECYYLCIAEYLYKLGFERKNAFSFECNHEGKYRGARIYTKIINAVKFKCIMNEAKAEGNFVYCIDKYDETTLKRLKHQMNIFYTKMDANWNKITPEFYKTFRENVLSCYNSRNNIIKGVLKFIQPKTSQQKPFGKSVELEHILCHCLESLGVEDYTVIYLGNSGFYLYNEDFAIRALSTVNAERIPSSREAVIFETTFTNGLPILLIQHGYTEDMLTDTLSVFLKKVERYQDITNQQVPPTEIEQHYSTDQLKQILSLNVATHKTLYDTLYYKAGDKFSKDFVELMESEKMIEYFIQSEVKYYQQEEQVAVVGFGDTE